VDTLWIGGGDGSVHHLLNRLRYTPLVFGVVPMGTMNALAKSLSVPSDPLEAVHWLLQATPSPMDLGEVQGLRFAVFASVGFHAAIMHNIDPDLKRRHGRLAFFESGIRTTAAQRKLPEFELQFHPQFFTGEHSSTDGVITEHGRSLVISNVHNYAGFGVVREQPNPAALLDLQLFRTTSMLAMARWYGHLRWGKGWRASVPGVEHYGTQKCRLISPKTLTVQLDGEPVQLDDPCELEFKVLPGVVQFLQHGGNAATISQVQKLEIAHNPSSAALTLPKAARVKLAKEAI
jgi:diacylglycerol kinase family enzyme